MLFNFINKVLLILILITCYSCAYESIHSGVRIKVLLLAALLFPYVRLKCSRYLIPSLSCFVVTSDYYSSGGFAAAVFVRAQMQLFVVARINSVRSTLVVSGQELMVDSESLVAS